MAFLRLKKNMLDEKRRLTKNADFQAVYERGKFVAGRPLVLYFLRNGTSTTRIGFVASKKVGKSHDRNRAKRMLRESVRPLIPLIKPGYDLVIVARSAIRDKTLVEITEIFSWALKKAGLVQGGMKY